MQRNDIGHIYDDLGPTTDSPTAETTTYIVDLLAELQTIAQIAGLTGLSNDLAEVLKKHSTKSDLG